MKTSAPRQHSINDNNTVINGVMQNSSGGEATVFDMHQCSVRFCCFERTLTAAFSETSTLNCDLENRELQRCVIVNTIVAYNMRLGSSRIDSMKEKLQGVKTSG